MTDIQKYLKKLDVEPYYAAIGSIKKKARHFLTIELSFNRHKHLLVLTPEQVLVYEMGIFSTTSLREKVSLSDIQAIRVEKNEFFKNRTIYFENEKNIYRVTDLKDNEVDEFVKALMDITHVIPEGDFRTSRRTILSDSLLRSLDIPPTSVLLSFSSDRAHLLMTALKLIALLPDGQVKQASLRDIGYLELRRGTYQLELLVFNPQASKTRGSVKPEYVLKFSPDCEDRLTAFCEQVNGITRQTQHSKLHTDPETFFSQSVSQRSSPSKPSHSQNKVSTSAPQKAQTDIPSKIKQLAELRDLGILTQEEFDAKKTDLLSRM